MLSQSSNQPMINNIYCKYYRPKLLFWIQFINVCFYWFIFTVTSQSSTVCIHSLQTFSIPSCGGTRLNPRLTVHLQESWSSVYCPFVGFLCDLQVSVWPLVKHEHMPGVSSYLRALPTQPRVVRTACTRLCTLPFPPFLFFSFYCDFSLELAVTVHATFLWRVIKASKLFVLPIFKQSAAVEMWKRFLNKWNFNTCGLENK